VTPQSVLHVLEEDMSPLEAFQGTVMALASLLLSSLLYPKP